MGLVVSNITEPKNVPQDKAYVQGLEGPYLLIPAPYKTEDGKVDVDIEISGGWSDDQLALLRGVLIGIAETL